MAVSEISINDDFTSSFEDLSTDWIGSVPRSVKSLKITLEIPRSLSQALISQLPPNLTKLIISSDHELFTDLHQALSQRVDVSKIWPPTLHTLAIGSVCRASDVKVLPKTLTHLDMGFWQSTRLTISAKDLPPNLTHCTFGNIYRKVACTITGTLPRSLTLFGQGDHFSFHYTRSTIEKLPPSLTQLTFRLTTIPPPKETPWLLPSHLSALGLHQWRVEWLAALPRHLTSLSISNLCGIPEALAVGPLDLFEHLPTSLDYLSFGSEKGEKSANSLASNSLAALTRLHELDCNKSLPFHTSVLSNIPRSAPHNLLARETTPRRSLMAASS